MIAEVLQEFLMGLLLGLDGIVYSFVNWIYQIILILANENIFGESYIMDNFINRVYTILGVVMLFVLAYSLLKSMVNPDELTKGKQSPAKIIKNVIISIAVIALTPTIFDFALNFQSSLLQENTIGKIIVGSSTGEGVNTTISQGGKEMAIGVLNAFIFPSDSKYCKSAAEEENATENNCEIIEVGNTTYGQIMNSAANTNLITTLPNLSSQMGGEDAKLIYYWGISTVCGVIVLFVLISICIEVAIRMIKLAVFQFMAPIPAIARVLPNEQSGKVFDNWVKATISTYVEIFIYLAILFFGVFAISLIREQIEKGNLLGALFNSDNILLGLIAQAFIIIGIVLFIKQAPKILKDITGLDGGKFGKAFMRGIGMMTSSIGGGATATIRTIANNKDKPLTQRIGRGIKAGLSANARGLWHGSKAEKFSDIPKMAGKTASSALFHQAQVDAAKGNINYYKQKGKDIMANASNWISGSFEAQQKELDLVNEFLKDAKAVKSESEGIVRDKKYLFTIGKIGENGKKDGNFGEKEIEVDSGRKDANGNAIIQKIKVPRVQIKENASLSEIDAIIESLKSSGDIEDARIADALNNQMQIRIKTLGKELTKASLQIENTSDEELRKELSEKFTQQYMSSASKGLINEISPTLTKINTAYDIVEKKFEKNTTLDAVMNFKNLKDDDGNSLDLQDNVSKLADELEKQSSRISQNIKIEQERRKANSEGKKS